MKRDLSFLKGKRVLLTGHTGFKGSWLSRILLTAGAEVTGYALKPPTDPSLFQILGLEKEMRSLEGDVRDLNRLRQCFAECRPEIVIHLAAQPLVRESYRDPVGTYETNVMGTVNLCECVRESNRTDTPVRSFLNVTTDKVYQNREIPGYGYREDDRLDGYDPYSNSKSCSELVTHSFTRSFFQEAGIPASTARAGNVIGGGDFAKDRIIPDCFRTAEEGRKTGQEGVIEIRNPHSVRPYQHVLEPLSVYLEIVRRQMENPEEAGAYNVGPSETDCVTTGELADDFVKYWGDGLRWETKASPNAPHEANFLKLDASLIRERFGYQPAWNIHQAVRYTAEWYRTYLESCKDSETVRRRKMTEETDREVREFRKDQKDSESLAEKISSDRSDA